MAQKTLVRKVICGDCYATNAASCDACVKCGKKLVESPYVRSLLESFAREWGAHILDA